MIGGDIIEKQKKIKTLAELPSTMTVEEVAAVLRISRAMAYQLVHADNGCPHCHIGKRILVPKAEFEAWLSSMLHSGVVEHDEKSE